MKKSLLSLAVLAALSGCSLIPDYQRPAAPVAAAWPQGEAYADAGPSQVLPGWRTFFQDSALRQLVGAALQNNRDLRVAALNLEAYRAQYRISRAALYPTLDAAASGARQRMPGDLSQTGKPLISSQYSATLEASWEVDFFGHLASLREEALQQYLASAEAQRSTHIALVASVASAYFTWQADQTLLQITQDTLETYRNSLRLTQHSFDVGVASALELQQARTAVDNARVSLAQYTRAVAQDRNALVLLLGSSLPVDLPQGLALGSDMLEEVPAGLPSDLLERRPDILQAEYQLRAANANIGAARAAFYPNISLTANAGTMSSELSGLFDGGSGTWLFQPQISLPIFNAGSLKASLEYSEVIRDTRVAEYEKAVQTAFQEVADGLAARQTYRDQMDAQAAQLASSQSYYDLAERRYRAGVDSYLTLLDAQRQLFSARQQSVLDRLSQLNAEVNLYKALGGGWLETQPDRAQASQAEGRPGA